VTLFFAHAVVSLILGTVRPIFFAFSILCVLCPIPFVLSAVHVRVDALPVGLVIQPFTMINIAIRMNESTASVRLVTEPVPLVGGAVWPHLPPLALTLIIVRVPLAYIDGAILETKRRPVDQILSLLMHVRRRGVVKGG
jgi:hypothetical protein